MLWWLASVQAGRYLESPRRYTEPVQFSILTNCVLDMIDLRASAVSITGNYRKNNEDAYVVHPEGRFFIVADGMGGQSAGEKASELAIELVPKRLEQTIDFGSEAPDQVVEKIDAAVAYANMEIMALSEIDPNYHNMGTTITFIVQAGGKLLVGGIGDSRVYRMRGDVLEQLTKDHSLTQALLDAGTINEQEAANHRYKNVLYKYLGTKDGGTGTEARIIDVQSGDRFVLCSDGVTDGIDEAKIKELLLANEDSQSAVEAIIPAAEAGGSKDNITCLVVNVV